LVSLTSLNRIAAGDLASERRRRKGRETSERAGRAGWGITLLTESTLSSQNGMEIGKVLELVRRGLFSHSP